MKNIHNKAGKISPMTAILLLAIIAIFAILVTTGTIKTPLTTTGGTSSNPTTQANTGSCALAPTVAIPGVDAVTQAVATPTTTNYIVNNANLGTSAPTAVIGESWHTISDLTGYLAGDQTFTVGCGGNNKPIQLYAYANATVSIRDDPVSSSNILTKSGGLYNATKFTGSQRNFPVVFQGTAQKSTSKIFWVVETPASSAINVTTVSASCGGIPLVPAAIPAGVTASNSASYRAAFEVPAVIGSAQAGCSLQVVSTATGTIVGTVKNTFYAEQTFVDASGVVQTGIYDTSANGNNAAKYQDTYAYDIVLQ